MKNRKNNIEETTKNLEKNKTTIVIAFIVFVVFYIILRFTTKTLDHGELGTFGDYMGGLLNPIIGFCAFLALLQTIEIQSKELAQSTEQLKESADALKEQSKLWEKQNFESSLFQLLKWLKEGADNFRMDEFLTPTEIAELNEKSTPTTGLPAIFHLTKTTTTLLKNSRENNFSEYLSDAFEQRYRAKLLKGHINKITIISNFINNFRKENPLSDHQLYYNLLIETLSVQELTLYMWFCLNYPELDCSKSAIENNFFESLQLGKDYRQEIKEIIRNKIRIDIAEN